MKSCPACKRTYFEDTFAFCLEDGSLLSAPYDPDATLRIQTPLLVKSVVRAKQNWNGECYANFSSDAQSRFWSDAVEYSFLSGGGSSWYSGTLRSLNPGERVWVNVAPYGFVGVGLVFGQLSPHRCSK